MNTYRKSLRGAGFHDFALDRILWSCGSYAESNSSFLYN